jgi:hypothetical protein
MWATAGQMWGSIIEGSNYAYENGFRIHYHKSAGGSIASIWVQIRGFNQVILKGAESRWYPRTLASSDDHPDPSCMMQCEMCVHRDVFSVLAVVG